MNVSPQCGFSVIEHPEGVIISATYLPCIKEKVGYNLSAMLDDIALYLLA